MGEINARLMQRFVLVGVILLCLAAEFAEAQSFYARRRERSLIFVGGAGTSSYYGELSNNNDYLQAKPTINVGLQMYLNRRIGIRADISWFELTGSDAKADDESRRQRNLSFHSDNFEISTVAIYNFFAQGRRFYQRPALNFYGFAGIGLCYFNPKTEYQGKTYALAPLHTELVSYSRVTPVIPMGLGLRMKVGPYTNLSFEGGYRTTFTDYLDDVSTIHHAASKFTDPIAAALSDRRPEVGKPIAPDGTQRGNPGKNDSYFLFTAKIEYYLPVNFLQGNSQQKTFKKKRKAFYRYNKRGGLKRK